MKNIIQKFSIQDCLALMIACCISPSVFSEVTLDGSVGTAGALSGPNYQITEEVGQRAGSNLFHSFGQFNLNNTESATFSGSAGIQNVIGRVTGGQASSIDGTLRVTIPDANLYLLNPAGILFGQNAKLDVPGSFHASTADLLKFQDGVQFESGVATPNPILTTALPEAFGFLGENPAGISVTGGNNTTLEVPNGEMISLVGGDITIKDSSLYAPGGQINLASVGSAGDVVVTELGLDTASLERMGNISISQDPLVPRVTIAPEIPAIANVDVSADTAGKVFIRGGQMVMENANILSDTTNGDGRGIDIGLTGDLNINGIAETPEIDSAPQSGITTYSLGNGNAGNINLDVNGLKLTHGTRIDSTASSSGNGGDLNINANSILLEGNQSNAVPRFITGTTATGNAGNITINNADNIELSDSAFILSSTAAEGNTGVITINTDALNVRGNASIQSFISETGKGDGGSLTVNANSVDVQTKGLIRSITLGKGDSGDIAIDTGTLEIHDDAQIISTVLESGDGNAGNLSINASSVKVHNKGGIASVTSGKGNAGNLAVNADVLQVHDNSIIFSGVSTTGDGKGGHLLVSAGSLGVSKNAAILNTTDGQGNAGDLTINANSLKVNDGKITNHTNSSGDAGNLKIKIGSLEFLGGVIGTLSAEDATGTNGNITIEANSIFMAGDNQNASQITGTVLGSNDTGNLTVISDRLEIKDRAIIDISNAGSGNTGNLLVDANEIVITNNAGGVNGIAANLTPRATGNSGGLTVKSQNLVMQNGARITAANFGSGNGGNLNIEATESIVVEGTSETTARNSSINNEAFSSGQTGDLNIPLEFASIF
ncbi:MAG: filamentous hemagglutinin N-terminal domain-containing protein [Methylococcaceae bacterium]